MDLSAEQIFIERRREQLPSSLGFPIAAGGAETAIPI